MSGSMTEMIIVVVVDVYSCCLDNIVWIELGFQLLISRETYSRTAHG